MMTREKFITLLFSGLVTVRKLNAKSTMSDPEKKIWELNASCPLLTSNETFIKKINKGKYGDDPIQLMFPHASPYYCVVMTASGEFMSVSDYTDNVSDIILIYKKGENFLTKNVTKAKIGGELSGVPTITNNNTIAYLMSRVVKIIDVAKGESISFCITDSRNLEEVAKGGSWMSEKNNVLVVRIEDTTYYDNNNRVDFRLRIFDTKKQTQLKVFELNKASSIYWHATGHGLLALWVYGEPAWELYNESFDLLVEHPLTKAVKNWQRQGYNVKAVEMNDIYPFALLILEGDEASEIWRVDLDKGDTTQLCTLKSARTKWGRSLSIQLSQDGEYLLIFGSENVWVQRIKEEPTQPRLLDLKKEGSYWGEYGFAFNGTSLACLEKHLKSESARVRSWDVPA